ncbi:MAG TPA: protein kinase [Vicinamibacterales bacterium]|jgi:Tol biopolymer transport system component|nr:protein kinase [Vicinamibacterales bacterium]
MHLAPGVRLGPYEIVAAIGAGGMGEVYRARDTRLDRDVAIKVLPPSFSVDADRLRRFTTEAQAIGRLNHPNIVAVFDVGSHEGAPFIVSEFLEGETLGARLQHGLLPPSKVIDLARQTAAGLAAAHEKGIVHRDIKPDNLFVTKEGRLKILDFGLARQDLPAETDVTRLGVGTGAGVVMGTVGYMSPEQVRGLPVDSGTDIFSFGAVLYEMLAGRRAFAGASPVETMHAILEADPPELSSVALPPAVLRVMSRCLEKDRTDRFHSAHDLGLALESIAAGSGPAPAAPAAQKPRLTAGGTAKAVAVAALAAAVGALAHSRFASPADAEPPTIESLTYSGHDSSPAASPDGKTIAFTSDRDGVPRIWLKQVAGGGELALTEGPDDAPRFSPDGSAILFVRQTAGGTALYRIPLLGGEPRKLIDDVSGADWSRDGAHLAFTRWVSPRSGSIVGIADADGAGAREVAFIAGRGLIAPRWSPDGKTIAAVNGLSTVSAGFGIDLIDVAGSPPRRLVSPHATMRLSAVLWSEDSRSIFYSEAESLAAWLAGSSARVVRQDTATGAARTLFWTANHSRTLDALGPGRLLLDTRSSRENLRELPLDGTAATRWLTRGNSTDRQPVYSPDGQWVAFSSNRGGNLDLWAVNRSSGTVRRLTEDPGDDWDLSYTPDGQHLLWGSNRSGPYEIWTANLDGSAPRQLSHDGSFAQNPAQTADGKWIVYISASTDRSGIWRMRADGSGPVRIVNEPVELPEVSPDGQYVLFVDGLRSLVRFVRLADGSPVPFGISVVERRRSSAVLGRARWMPDGRSIAFIGQDEHGVNGVFAQDFVPGRDTSTTRRKLGGFDPENAAESLAVSPDGRFLTIAGWEQLFNVMVANNVQGVGKQKPR